MKMKDEPSAEGRGIVDGFTNGRIVRGPHQPTPVRPLTMRQRRQRKK